ncbi:G protein-coupled receptor [Caenorhabditis elegans]|uniref:G protein-coupled receptor n=1 Tax=Caenorhabditis elegans TaxID=6239 RepID=Q9XX84_CAEEL|nr:G protein-coupled receptor [Caenorhabditis elegans]CAA20951.1 G protein-coupled receptor [Caenorhabditis elegans]|eukprot:NP_507301.1 Serpentine Receptor, class I [Caenorhabditis elegans]
MTAPCPEAPPDGFLLTLHLIGGISLLMNLLTMYMIWFESPGMHGYRYCLTYVQIVSFLVEFIMAVVIPIHIFLPMKGGITLREGFRTIMSNQMALTIWIFLLCLVLPASITCFIYRHNAASQINENSNSSTKYSHKTLAMILNHIFPFLTAFGTWQCQNTTEQKYEYVRQNYPQCLFWVANDNFEAYDYHENPWIIRTVGAGIGFLVVSSAHGAFLGVHTMIVLQRLRSHMSVQTYQMHRTALISLAMQMVCPCVFIFVVYFYALVAWIDDVELQVYISRCPCIMSTHSLLLCTVMIMSNKNYRQVLKDKLSKLFRLSRPIGSQIGSEVEPSMMRTFNNVVVVAPVS